MAGHRPLLGPWGGGAAGARRRGSGIPGPYPLNGLGRGCLPADHDLAFSRTRGRASGNGADVALLIGAPIDFRLGFGGSFGEKTKLIRLDAAPNELTANRLPDVDLVGDVRATLEALVTATAGTAAERRLDRELRQAEGEKRAAEVEELNDPRAPLHPVRIYGGARPSA